MPDARRGHLHCWGVSQFVLKPMYGNLFGSPSEDVPRVCEKGEAALIRESGIGRWQGLVCVWFYCAKFQTGGNLYKMKEEICPSPTQWLRFSA